MQERVRNVMRKLIDYKNDDALYSYGSCMVYLTAFTSRLVLEHKEAFAITNTRTHSSDILIKQVYAAALEMGTEWQQYHEV
jgi:hypothetical protein